MRISDWSSDVCSSDLSGGRGSSARVRKTMGRSSFVVAAAATVGPIARATRNSPAVASSRLGQNPPADRKGGGEGKRGSVRVDLGGRRIIKKKNTQHNQN